MTGRGIDQVLANPSLPNLYEPYVGSALDYVAFAEKVSGPIPRPVDDSYIWGAALDVFDEIRSDARIVNLETSVTTSESAELRGINYRMHPDNIAVLTAAKIDCCVLANNHVLDWGVPGLLETLESLGRTGIAVAGAGPDVRSAGAPAILEIDDQRRILVFAFGAVDSGIPLGWSAGPASPGVHALADFSQATVDSIARDVEGTKRTGDIAVASIHWGDNWGYEIPTQHRRFAHALINSAGIDIVHGHSSHHPMAIEVYRERPILYGCGDFVNDYEGIRGREEFRSDLVPMYFVTVDGDPCRLVRLRIVPLQIKAFRLDRPSRSDRAWVGQRLDRESRRFGHRITMEDDAFSLVW